jgi:hypothetical protein
LKDSIVGAMLDFNTSTGPRLVQSGVEKGNWRVSGMAVVVEAVTGISLSLVGEAGVTASSVSGNVNLTSSSGSVGLTASTAMTLTAATLALDAVITSAHLGQWVNTAEQELTGSIGATETAFTNAGCKFTISANTIVANDQYEIEAILDCTGAGTATVSRLNLFWGGVSGVRLTSNIDWGALNAGYSWRLVGTVRVPTIGGSPVWHSYTNTFGSANDGYVGNAALYDQTTQPTNASIDVVAAVKFDAGADSSDKVKLRSFRMRRVRAT